MAAGIVAATSSQASRRSGSPRNERSRMAAKPGRDEPDPVGPEVDEQRGQRPDVEHHAERQRGDERVVPAEQERDDDQVPGRRDRQELGESLHDPHDQGLDDVSIDQRRITARVRDAAPRAAALAAHRA